MSEGISVPDGWQQRQRAQAAVFDQIGARYDDVFPHKDGQRHLVNELLERLPTAARVLDVGCGTGRPTAAQLVVAGCQVVAAERVELAVATPLRLAGQPYVPTASIGMAWTDRPMDAEALVAQADASMYRVKSRRTAGQSSGLPAT
jgi:GGDEF domain-containing protein